MSNLIQKLLEQAITTFSAGPDIAESDLIDLYNVMDQIRADDVNLDISFARISAISQREAPITYIDIYEDKKVSMGIFVLKPNKILPLHNHPEMYGLIKVLAGKLAVDSYSVNTPKTFEVDKEFSIPCFGSKPGSSIYLNSRHNTTPRFVDAFSEAYPETSEAATSTMSSNLDEKEIAKAVQETVEVSMQTSSTHLSQATQGQASLETATSTTALDSMVPEAAEIPLKRVVSAEFNGRDIVGTGSKPCILKPYEKNIHEIECVEGPAAFLDILAPPYFTEIPNVGPRICTYFGNLGLLFENVYLLQEVEAPRYFWTDTKPYLGPKPTVEVE